MRSLSNKTMGGNTTSVTVINKLQLSQAQVVITWHYCPQAWPSVLLCFCYVYSEYLPDTRVLMTDEELCDECEESTLPITKIFHINGVRMIM